MIYWMVQCFAFPFNPAIPLCIFITTVKHRTLFSCQITPRMKNKVNEDRGRKTARVEVYMASRFYIKV